MALYAREAKISPEVARTVLTQHTHLDIDPVPGPTQRAIFEKIVPALAADATVRSEQDARTAADTLFEPTFATLPLLFLVAWQWAASSGGYSRAQLPPPADVVSAVGELISRGELWHHVAISTQRVLAVRR